MNKKYIILILCIFILWDCKKEEKISEKKAELKKNSIGVGPVKKVVLVADINSKMVKNEKTNFIIKKIEFLDIDQLHLYNFMPTF